MTIIIRCKSSAYGDCFLYASDGITRIHRLFSMKYQTELCVCICAQIISKFGTRTGRVLYNLHWASKARHSFPHNTHTIAQGLLEKGAEAILTLPSALLIFWDRFYRVNRPWNGCPSRAVFQHAYHPRAFEIPKPTWETRLMGRWLS